MPFLPSIQAGSSVVVVVGVWHYRTLGEGVARLDSWVFHHIAAVVAADVAAASFPSAVATARRHNHPVSLIL